MSEFGYAISWLALSPIALITDVLAIIVITHYFPYYHGNDVTLISILVAMIGNAVFVLPIPAYLEVKDMYWTPRLCYGYVWCVLTFRVAQVLSLMVLSIHWSTLLKMSAQKKTYVSTKYLKFTVVFVWISSSIFGVLPIVGAVSEDFNASNSCKFLAFNLGTGYALFFLIFNLVAMFVSILCCCDSMILIKHIKRLAGSKYQAGRFQLPDRRADVQMHAGSSMAEKYHRLQFARDLSKFAMIFVLLAIAINHFPYTVFQALQLFTDIDRPTLEVASLYLIGLEAVLLPHALWLLSRRYRHALTYQWKVYVLRNKDIEEDEPTACTLQSYVSRERDRISLAPSRPASTIGYSAGGTLRSMKSEVIPRPTIQMNGQTPVSPVSLHREMTGIMSISRTPPANGIIKGEVHVERPPSLYDERPIDIQNLEVTRIDGRGYMSDVGVSCTAPHREEVQRSASSASRQHWKDHMRKKHFPPIFINEGYEPGDKSPCTEETKVKSVYKEGVATTINGNSLNYYMSSDYHPDCLTESLPRNRITHAPSTESETGDIYRSEDIEEVLNTSLANRSVARNSGRNVSRNNDIVQGQRNSFRTFKTSPELPTSQRHVQKGIYNTFEDLSQMDMRGENEIEFDNESIPLDEIDSEVHSISFRTTPTNVNTVKYENNQRHLSSFKPDDSGFRHTFPKHSRPETSTVLLATTSFGCSSTDADTRQGGVGVKNNIPDEIQALAKMHLEPSVSSKMDYEFSTGKQNEKRSLFLFGQEFTKRVEEDGFNDGNATNLMLQKGDKSIDDENASSGSNSSVTLSPYKEGPRHRPWMDDYDEQTDDHSQIGDPLVLDSDTDTLRDSQDSTEMRLGLNFDTRYPGSLHSELSTPVSSIFDEETDRGFEDALEMHANPGATVYGGVGLCFESIKEEPEDLTSSGSNPFLSNGNDDEEFRTQAVISRSSKSNSRTSSCTSVSDYPYSGSPRNTQLNPNIPFSEQVLTPVIVTTDADLDCVDSGFTSGLERGNNSDSSGPHELMARDRVSPWPEEYNKIENNEMSFESNFCADASQRNFTSTPISSKLITFDSNEETKIIPGANTQNVQLFTNLEKKPVHKALEAIRSNSRPTPVRAQSFERYNSPSPERRLQRGQSFETARKDIKPAYF